MEHIDGRRGAVARCGARARRLSRRTRKSRRVFSDVFWLTLTNKLFIFVPSFRLFAFAGGWIFTHRSERWSRSAATSTKKVCQLVRCAARALSMIASRTSQATSSSPSATLSRCCRKTSNHSGGPALCTAQSASSRATTSCRWSKIVDYILKQNSHFL